jgi:hypothetical protein
MDEGQPEANWDTSKPTGRTFRRGPDDNEEKKERHRDFGQEAAGQAVFAGAQIAITVGGETTRNPAGLARCNNPSAAKTAAPQSPNTNQNVPKNSAVTRLGMSINYPSVGSGR